MLILEAAAAISLGGADAQVIATTYEPRAAQEYSLSLSFRCRSQRMEVRHFSPGGPDVPPAAIVVNGRPVQGEAMPALLRDLSNPRAVYRLSGLCSQRTNVIVLYIYTGEQTGEDVVYQVGRATIRGGRLERYEPLQRVNAATFWFR